MIPRFIELPSVVRLAAHTFSALDTATFDIKEYSRLKFGSNRVAARFGYEMADAFFDQHRDMLDRSVVIPAPSTTVPVASTLLSHHFMNRINTRLARENAMPVEWSLVHRKMTYNNNYADLAKEERRKLLAADDIFFNRDFVEGKTLLFVDDCTITGTHEDKISSYLAHFGMTNPHAFICFAKYQGNDHSIEMRLNNAEIKTANDLIDLAWEPQHSVTTRSLRLLLEHPEEDFERLIDNAPENFVYAVYHAIIVKGYNRHGPYVDNFTQLSHRLAKGRLEC